MFDPKLVQNDFFCHVEGVFCSGSFEFILSLRLCRCLATLSVLCSIHGLPAHCSWRQLPWRVRVRTRAAAASSLPCGFFRIATRLPQRCRRRSLPMRIWQRRPLPLTWWPRSWSSGGLCLPPGGGAAQGGGGSPRSRSGVACTVPDVFPTARNPPRGPYLLNRSR
jgi:hypothetical protein